MFHRRNMDKNRPRFKTDKRFLIVVALAIVFTAAVLRAPITSMGALCVEVQDDLGLSSAAVSYTHLGRQFRARIERTGALDAHLLHLLEHRIEGERFLLDMIRYDLDDIRGG